MAIAQHGGRMQTEASRVSTTGRVVPLVENVTESATACVLTMVQGNILALGVGHWIVASQTGLAAGVLASLVLWLSGGRRRFVVAAVLAVATAGVDYLVHPGGFGPVAFEAVVTGAAAGGLSLAVGALRARYVRR